MTVTWFGMCMTCDKHSYSSKKTAKAAARALHPGSGLRPYRCPADAGWHIGHLASQVIRGKKSRGQRYG